MEPGIQLEALRDLADRLALEIDTVDLSHDEFSARSGYCKLKGRHLLLLDRKLLPEEQVEIIFRALQHFDLETIYVPAWIRERWERDKNETVETDP
ncbi:MAG: hypothetical protein GWM98_04205 [Nitrospinaceae bacterium]|nr:hypothetical protein [Nitrospinaceae bacterium]NIR53852.1 hypothetical protein [Nitrospinaceae bacterium]NIS84262.1 hypothetical protein [Nitrospinaceae bacterium]NIT81069.1 hypothetical protein [Nitrospinaceae bacterium]NIU43355.1 hypothetical protein [Nitrospinaceae bacterium]